LLAFLGEVMSIVLDHCLVEGDFAA
jgi:hypothetical protein